MRLLHSIPVANGTGTFYLPKGQFAPLMIVYDVVTSTGEQITRADCGNIRLNWNGDDVINIDAEMLNLLNNVYGGFAEFTSAIAGQNRMVVIIPTGLWYDSANVYDVGDQDKVYIKLDFNALTAKSVSGNVLIYGKPRIGIMSYFHKLVSRYVVAGGAGNIADTYPVSNISEVYFKNPTGSNVTEIQIQKDNETIVDGPVVNLQTYSDFVHKLEGSTTTLAIDFGETRDIRENVGSQIAYQIRFSAAGTAYMYISYIEFVPDKKVIESRNRASNKIIQAINKGK